MSDSNASDQQESKSYVGLMVFLGSVAVMLLCYYTGFQIGALLAAAVLISVVIWQACDPFAEAAQWIGTTFRIPGSVRGATLDAIASSMPELFSGIFFVYVAMSGGLGDMSKAEAGAEGYGATIATCAGSAVYNMMLIPALCALVIASWRTSRPTIDVEPEVITRDGLWFLGCEMILIVFLYQAELHWWTAIVFLAAYVVYISQLYRDARRYRKALDAQSVGKEVQNSEDEEDELPSAASVFFGFAEVPLNSVSVWLIIAISTVVAAAACYYLVEVTYSTAHLLQIPSFFVAVILAAAVSSVPDTFLSIGAAMRGDDSGAVSNAFGSNIFDICICLSIPLLVNSYLNGWQPVPLIQDGKPMVGLVGLRMLLWVLTLITLLILWHNRQLTRRKAYILVGLYAIFVGYAVLGSLGVLQL